MSSVTLPVLVTVMSKVTVSPTPVPVLELTLFSAVISGVGLSTVTVSVSFASGGVSAPGGVAVPVTALVMSLPASTSSCVTV